MKRSTGGSHGRDERRRVPVEVFDAGQKVRDGYDRRSGVVLDCAQQYSHPKADPVHSYLVRWDDGQVEAISEAAFHSPRGVEPVD